MPIVTRAVTRAFSAADSRTVLGRAKAGDVILLEVIEATGDNHSTLRKIINSPYTHCMIALGNGEFAQVPIPRGGNSHSPQLHDPIVGLEQISFDDQAADTPVSQVGGLRFGRVEVIDTGLSDREGARVADRARNIAHNSEFSAPAVEGYARKWIEQHKTNPGVEDWDQYQNVVNENEANRGQNPKKSGMTCFGLIVETFHHIDWPTVAGFTTRDYVTSHDIQTAFEVPLTVNGAA
jgi:hypothetical protein